MEFFSRADKRRSWNLPLVAILAWRRLHDAGLAVPYDFFYSDMFE